MILELARTEEYTVLTVTTVDSNVKVWVSFSLLLSNRLVLRAYIPLPSSNNNEHKWRDGCDGFKDEPQARVDPINSRTGRTASHDWSGGRGYLNCAIPFLTFLTVDIVIISASSHLLVLSVTTCCIVSILPNRSCVSHDALVRSSPSDVVHRRFVRVVLRRATKHFEKHR